MDRSRVRINEARMRNGPSNAYPQLAANRRRPLLLAGLAVFILLTLLLSSSSVPSIPASAKDAAQHIPHPSISRPKLPSLYNPFRSAAHEPPIQRNSTSGEAKWFSDWKWLNPFSSSITLDENRSVLPPLRTRPPMYTYYDTNLERDDDTKAAEGKLLLIWRRAWWAQGFKPVILGKAEAMSNPLYETLQKSKLDAQLEVEMMRWLAWGHMGTGILANWLVLPMGPYEDDLLSFLRRGQYPRLARYEHLGSGLFSGDGTSIDAAITSTLASPNLPAAKTFIEAVSDPDIFTLDPRPQSIAFYETSTILAHYAPIGEDLLKKQSLGLGSLATLINAHLHTTFQNHFTNGLAILSPYPSLSTILSLPAIHLANSLVSCPTSPIPASCPPNRPKCEYCTSSAPVPILFPSTHLNVSKTFTIGTIPHPHTLATLLGKRPLLDVRYIRRETSRDRWLVAVTNTTLGPDMAGPSRIVHFKEEVAGEFGAANGLWRTAETRWDPRDLEWHFGFELPINSSTTASAGSKAAIEAKGQENGANPAGIPEFPDLVPKLNVHGATNKAPALVHQEPDFSPLEPLVAAITRPTTLAASPSTAAGKSAPAKPPPAPSPPDFPQQLTLLQTSSNTLKKSESAKDGPESKLVAVLEAWNMADSEAWRFVRAFEARSKVERRKWVQDEKRYVGWVEDGDDGEIGVGGGAGREGKEGWGRWLE